MPRFLCAQVQISLRSRRLISFNARVKKFIFAHLDGISFRAARAISPPAYDFKSSFQFADGIFDCNRFRKTGHSRRDTINLTENKFPV